MERENYEADHGGLTLGPFGGYEFDEDSNKLIIPQYSDDRKQIIPQYSDDRKRSSVFRERTSNVYGKCFEFNKKFGKRLQEFCFGSDKVSKLLFRKMLQNNRKINIKS